MVGALRLIYIGKVFGKNQLQFCIMIMSPLLTLVTLGGTIDI
jgi:hypothetical protein